MLALYHQNRSTRRARLFTALIILAMIALVSGVFDVWLYRHRSTAATDQIRAAMTTSGTLIRILQAGADSDRLRRPHARPRMLVGVLDRQLGAIVLSGSATAETQPDRVYVVYRQLLAEWDNDVKPSLDAFLGNLATSALDLNHVALIDRRDAGPPPQIIQGLAALSASLAQLDLVLHEHTSLPWSIPNAIHYAALLALLVTAVFLRRTGATPSFTSPQNREVEPPTVPRDEQAAGPGTSRGEISAHAGQSLALLQTVLAAFVDNPESPESFLLLLREVERLIGAKCSAIFIFKDFDDHGLPLVCTDPDERDCFVDLLRERMPASGLHDLEAILTFVDPPHPGTQIIAVQLAASDGLQKGLLLVKRQPALPLSSGEKALLNGVGKHLAAIICSAQRAQLNRRVALCEERAVIARELHDSLAQSLSYLKIQTVRLQNLLHVDKRKKALDYADADAVLQELRTNLNLAYRQLRELITTFRLTMAGRTLGQALTDSVEEFENRSSVALTLDNRVPDGLLSVDEEMHVLQIVRECVSNVVRHAQAKRAEVSLNMDDVSAVHITVDDDGVGMDTPRSLDQHHGLVIMQQRAHSLGGDMRLLRSPDGGTRVQIRFPSHGAHSDMERLNRFTDHTQP